VRNVRLDDDRERLQLVRKVPGVRYLQFYRHKTIFRRIGRGGAALERKTEKYAGRLPLSKDLNLEIPSIVLLDPGDSPIHASAKQAKLRLSLPETLLEGSSSYNEDRRLAGSSSRCYSRP
jgi:hypothetical protein